MKKTVFSKIFSTVAIMTMVFAMVPFQAAHAGGTENVIGYAFSDMPDGSDQNKPCTGIDPTDSNNEHCGRGLGWISLNSINHNGALNYGVNLNRATGNFEGNGYAEYGGWVKFNPTGQFPSGPGTVASGAKVDPDCLSDETRTCKVTGWIRFISGSSTGWDGWVSLSGTGYGLELDKPDANGVRKFLPNKYAWGSWIVGWVDFTYASVKGIDMCPNIPDVQTSVPAGYTLDVDGNCIQSPDICPTTVITNPNHPLTGQNDPKTIGLQTVLPNTPAPYSVNGTQCGIWDCTIKGYPQYNGSATISDNSLCQCPANTTFVNGRCIPYECTPGDPDCPIDVCPSTVPFLGTAYDPNTVGNQTQSDIDAIGYEVIGGKCGIFNCKDPYAENNTPSATIHVASMCTYAPGVHEICFNGQDDDSDGQVDEGCPTKGPKIPVYCETGGRNCPTGGTVQP